MHDANFTDKEEASCGGFLLVDRFGEAELAGDSGSARLSIASRLPLLFRSNQFAREIAHGIPGCGEAYRENGDEHQQYVHPTNAHGIGFDDEVAAIAEAQEAKLHLEPAEEQPQEDARHRSDGGNHAALVEKDAHNGALRSAKVAQGLDVVALVDDKHGHRTDNVETGHEDDERQEEIGHGFLYLHDAEGLGVLFVAVAHGEASLSKVLQFGLCAVNVRASLEREGHGGNAVGLFEEFASEADGGDEVVVIVGALVDLEKYARRLDVEHVETLHRVRQVDALASAGRANGHGAVVDSAKLLRQSDAGHAVFHFCGMGNKAAEATARGGDALYVRHLGEMVVHTLDIDNDGAAHKEHHGLFLQAVGEGLHTLVAAQAVEHFVVGIAEFARHRAHLQLGVEMRVEPTDEFAEAIEDAQGAEQGHCSKGYPECRDSRDDVDGVVALLGEEVAPRNEEGERHGGRAFENDPLLGWRRGLSDTPIIYIGVVLTKGDTSIIYIGVRYFFSSSSIWSM